MKEISRARPKSARCRNGVNFHNRKGMESIFNCNHNCIINDIKNEFYHIRILLSNTRKITLKENTSEILLNGLFIRTDLIKFQYYSLILDTIVTQLYKSE